MHPFSDDLRLMIMQTAQNCIDPPRRSTAMPPATSHHLPADKEAARTAKRARVEDTAEEHRMGHEGEASAAAEPGIQLSVEDDSIIIVMHARLAACEVEDAMQAAHRLQLHAAGKSLSKLGDKGTVQSQDIQVSQRSRGTETLVHEFEVTVRVCGEARAHLGILASLVESAQQSTARLRLPEGADVPAWLLLDVLRLQFGGPEWQHSHAAFRALQHMQVCLSPVCNTPVCNTGRLCRFLLVNRYCPYMATGFTVTVAALVLTIVQL